MTEFLITWACVSTAIALGVVMIFYPQAIEWYAARIYAERTGQPVRKFRAQYRRSRVSATGKHAFSVGIRLGYWPCLKAPFVAIDLGTRRLEVWHGLRSYKKEAIG